MSDQFAVVLRFAAMFPDAAARMLMHAKRSGGELDNVEMAFSKRNRIYVGENFPDDIKAEILEMMKKNREEEVAALTRAKRGKQAQARNELGLVDPWKSSEKGPLREVILTAHKGFFLAAPGTPDDEVLITHGVDKLGNTIVNRLSKAKIEAFDEAGRKWFGSRFPGALRHLRLDLDEETPHFHGLIFQRTEKTSGRRGRQLLIQPTSHPFLRNYELAQDDAGEFFASIGLVRGERTAEMRREARKLDQPVPEAARHVSPKEEREARAKAMAEERDKIAEEKRKLDQRDVDTFLEQMAANSASGLARLRTEEAGRKLADANERIAEAIVTSDRAKTERASAEKLGKALKTGIIAIEERQLDYRPATAKEKEGLEFGPAAPKEKAWRDRLAEIVRPAYDHLVGFAKSLFRLRQEKAEMTRRAAELARRASVVARAEAAAGRRAPQDLAAVADGAASLSYTEASFPDAWAIPTTADTRKLQAELDAMPNLALRNRWKASRDAVLLCDDDAALKDRFARGIRALEVGAEQRGFDLEAGRHDPARASDPKRARLHTDQLAEGIALKRTDGDRQRHRG